MLTCRVTVQYTVPYALFGVKYCVDKGFHILAQNRGAVWATFDQRERIVLINQAGLNDVIFNADKTQATIGGGSTINNTIAHAYAAGAIIETGNCNCVGTLGAALGGGYGNLMGLYGFGVDNILSLAVVTADGQIRNVTPSSDPDLFWGLRGAGPNFGIVTSAVVKSYPATEDDMQAWSGGLVYDSDDLEEIVQAIQDLELQPDMNVFLYYISNGSGSNTPMILVTVFLYRGNATSGHAVFASLYAIGPIQDTTIVLPYNQWNAGGDQFCNFGARKPSYGAGFQKMVPAIWRQIWDKYVAFQQQPGAENSVVLLEAYSLEKARLVDDATSSFPHRNVNFNAVAIPWYEDTTLDASARAFGSVVRDLWRSTDELAQNSTYVLFLLLDKLLFSS
ncbi:putative FAD-binding PCMH-type domain-containing protein [Seiridium unicorne]|uniref:FAD-binding PCMH-type domain-containing protein n=1 Tax=Seiridium unicorne TaxID=138068 RepID=A0ABR2V2Z9_9PEZI